MKALACSSLVCMCACVCYAVLLFLKIHRSKACYLSFRLWQNTRHKLHKGRKVYFCPLTPWLFGTMNLCRTSWQQEACRRKACTPHGRQEAEREEGTLTRYHCQKHIPTHLLPTRPHVSQTFYCFPKQNCQLWTEHWTLKPLRDIHIQTIAGKHEKRTHKPVVVAKISLLMNARRKNCCKFQIGQG